MSEPPANDPPPGAQPASDPAPTGCTLRARWVVPIDGPPLRDGLVHIVGDHITAVAAAAGATAGARFQSRTSELDAAHGDATDEVLDLGDVILTPGLVNPHTHLELTCYAGQLSPAGFWDWLPRLVVLRAAPGQFEREQQGVRDGAWQSLRAGVTCVGDISRRNLSWPILREIPVRKVCFVELLALADHPPRDLPELRAAVAAVEEDPRLTVGITPHTPYTVPADQFAGAIALATELDRPWCAHWAETPEECEYLRGGRAGLHPFLDALLAQCGVTSPRCAPLEFLERCTRGRRPGLLAHCNYPGSGDAARLAAAGHAVVYCPRAHRFFGHQPHPYQALRAAGVTVAIGTDSAASNENLAPLEELRFLRRAAESPVAPVSDRCTLTDRAPSPGDLLAMITRDAARALGLADQIGTLTPGKQADLAAFPCPREIADPLAFLVDAAPRPTAVWVAGQRVIG